MRQWPAASPEATSNTSIGRSAVNAADGFSSLSQHRPSASGRQVWRYETSSAITAALSALWDHLSQRHQHHEHSICGLDVSGSALDCPLKSQRSSDSKTVSKPTSANSMDGALCWSCYACQRKGCRTLFCGFEVLGLHNHAMLRMRLGLCSCQTLLLGRQLPNESFHLDLSQERYAQIYLLGCSDLLGIRRDDWIAGCPLIIGTVVCMPINQ